MEAYALEACLAYSMEGNISRFVVQVLAIKHKGTWVACATLLPKTTSYSHGHQQTSSSSHLDTTSVKNSTKSVC